MEELANKATIQDIVATTSKHLLDRPTQDQNPSGDEREYVLFKIIHNKTKYDIRFPIDDTIIRLKYHLQSIIGVPPWMQKVMFKGLVKASDETTLREVGVHDGARVMVVGSKLDDIISATTPGKEDFSDEKTSSEVKHSYCEQSQHKKVLDKGVPDDILPGIKNSKDPLPPYALTGMINKSGSKVRLSFKLEQDQLWISTKERTDKIPMTSIKNIVNEAIVGHEEYHIMALQLGPTEASRLWIYWVPAQYIDSIKSTILGRYVDSVKDALLERWQYF